MPKDHLLGPRGGGFVVAQTRLGGGRIHHAMRTIGQVRKSFDQMCERALSRTTQGSLLADKQMVQEKIADSWIDIEQFRLLVLRTAWRIDKYKDYLKVRKDIAAVKAAMPKVFHDVVVRALQVHGSLGVTPEMPFAEQVMESFVMGLADGPTEVHKITLARQVLRDYKGTAGLVPDRPYPGAARGRDPEIRRPDRTRGGRAMTTRPVQYDFSGKVVVITGGSRGIGHAMALGFAAAGAKLAIASRKIDTCEETVKEIRALGADGSAHAAHVGKWEDCNRLVDEVYARWGRADVLINNAGISPLAPSSAETSEELFDKIIGVNLKGPFRLSALFGSRMVAGEGGAIINISSTAAIRPDPETAPYSAAKAGLNILTVAFAKEYGPKVRVNCIMCGPFHTDISKGWSRTADFTKRAKETFPLQRAGDAEEVVGAALYFASPAASYTTGAVLTIDGGSAHLIMRTTYES